MPATPASNARTATAVVSAPRSAHRAARRHVADRGAVSRELLRDASSPLGDDVARVLRGGGLKEEHPALLGGDGVVPHAARDDAALAGA